MIKLSFIFDFFYTFSIEFYFLLAHKALILSVRFLNFRKKSFHRLGDIIAETYLCNLFIYFLLTRTQLRFYYTYCFKINL